MKQLLITLLLLFALNAYAQIDECTGYEELYRGRHKINGMTYGHPYTTFDRHNGITFVQMLERIRNQIKREFNDSIRPVFDAYELLYKNATLLLPNYNDNGLYRIDANDDKDHTQLPVWGKNNAFVFLIGLDGQGKERYVIKF